MTKKRVILALNGQIETIIEHRKIVENIDIGSLAVFEQGPHTTVGIVRHFNPYSINIDILAMSYGITSLKTYVTLKDITSYKIIKPDDLALYIHLKHKTPNFERVLKEDMKA